MEPKWWHDLKRCLIAMERGDLIAEVEAIAPYVRREAELAWRMGLAVAAMGRLDGSHDVRWHGVFRGTEEDPREVGWCVECNREVYEGERHERSGR